VLYRQAFVDTVAFQMAWIMTTGNDLHSLAGPQEFTSFLSSTLSVAPILAALGAMIAVALLSGVHAAASGQGCDLEQDLRRAAPDLSGAVLALAVKAVTCAVDRGDDRRKRVHISKGR
jgi:hypothetical protein